MRGRKPNDEPTIRWNVEVPASLAAQLEILLLDPMRKRAAYGKKTGLVVMLLREWVKGQIPESVTTRHPVGCPCEGCRIWRAEGHTDGAPVMSTRMSI